jgi:AMP nucleosidase
MVSKQNPPSGSIHESYEAPTEEAKKRIARDMLTRYTGLEPDGFAPSVILTNFSYYLEQFAEISGEKVLLGQYMRTVTSKKLGVTVVDMRVGSPTAAIIIELLAAASPQAVLLLGMCGGLHRSLKVGDFILPMAAIREESVSRHFMPTQVPALPTFKVQKFVSQVLVAGR